MTVKEVAEALKVSTDLIKKRIKEIYPNKMKNGKTTYLNQMEVTFIKMRIQENSNLATYDDHRRLKNMPTTELEEEILIEQAMRIQANRVIRLQEENKLLLIQNSNQKDLISGLTEDITIYDKLNIIKRVVKKGGSPINERYRELYKVFLEQEKIDLALRTENYNKKQVKVKDRLSIIRFAEKEGFIDNLFKYASKLFTQDVEIVRQELGI